MVRISEGWDGWWILWLRRWLHRIFTMEHQNPLLIWGVWWTMASNSASKFKYGKDCRCFCCANLPTTELTQPHPKWFKPEISALPFQLGELLETLISLAAKIHLLRWNSKRPSWAARRCYVRGPQTVWCFDFTSSVGRWGRWSAHIIAEAKLTANSSLKTGWKPSKRKEVLKNHQFFPVFVWKLGGFCCGTYVTLIVTHLFVWLNSGIIV